MGLQNFKPLLVGWIVGLAMIYLLYSLELWSLPTKFRPPTIDPHMGVSMMF